MLASTQDFRGLILKHWDAHDAVNATNLDLMEKIAGVSDADMDTAEANLKDVQGRLLSYMKDHGLTAAHFEAESTRMRDERSPERLEANKKHRERNDRVLAQYEESEDEESEEG